jgi:hypothetical protein
MGFGTAPLGNLFAPVSDEAARATLDAAWLESKPFAHLPVLGIPGWCEANEVPDFFRDASVFRAAKPHAL